MLSKSLVAATVALMYGATAQAGGPLLPRLQSGLKQLPALTAPVVATARSLTSIKALPALSAPALSAASLPGLSGEAKAYDYYYPPYDPGSGADWLTFNTTVWPGQVSAFSLHVVAVVQEFATDAGAMGLAATGILGNGPCNCAGGTPLDAADRAIFYVSTVLDFGVSRGSGLGNKVGPVPLPKRPEELSALTPTLISVNEAIFGSYYGY
jgi:hypothetical protein